MNEIRKILIVGCGNMGGAMLGGWLRAGAEPERFVVVDPVLASAPAGVTLHRELSALDCDAVLLGIKPQQLDALAPALAPLVAGKVVLSILAGVELASLRARFPAARALVRVMPNLAAALGKSPIGLAGESLASADREAIAGLFAPLGTPEWIDERHFDLITALVGSGPAFVYDFISMLAKAATELGLDAAQAERLAVAMTEGAAMLAAADPAGPEELARRVTSPGGTTQAGREVLARDAALERLIAATLRAARDRGTQLAMAARG